MRFLNWILLPKAYIKKIFVYSMIPLTGIAYADTSSLKDQAYGQKYSQAILQGVDLNTVFTFNDKKTTKYGPAYADIIQSNTNFLQCLPPTGRTFSYALCYYSGPAFPTGSNSENPPLPCTLSDDGTYANCTCYEISTDTVSSKMPYLVDINAISNLSVYEQTVQACGKNGEKCASSNITPPVCDAINTNLLVPGADLISVYSPVYKQNYHSDQKSNSTSCTEDNAGWYAGCMTAPCYQTGQKDQDGNPLVQCKCPIFKGPYQIGQANQNCDANKATPDVNAQDASSTPTTQSSSQKYVWSAAYTVMSQASDHCIPDLPGQHGCGLYNPEKNYQETIDPNGQLCKNVCQAYGSNTQSNTQQTAYTCDATMCTTLGIGQENNPNFPPPKLDQMQLLNKACTAIQSVPQLEQIILVETLAKCSCCASQVCQCNNINEATNKKITNLNLAQEQLGIITQCESNHTLCGQQ
ncbi:hypothetical protein [Facilibium subflavum]|uniref:hypothetical protein n=1 Tax=Facilibium subflavum TaxID=2219058 RepID=UPI000E65B6FF|nr:hypothetical protein [Facilibium subflavum]